MDKRVLTVGSLVPNLVTAITTQKHPEKQPVSVIKRPVVKPTINLLQNSRRFSIQPAKGNLLLTALAQGQDVKYKCQKGTCGVCTVKIENGIRGLSFPDEKEQEKLKEKLQQGYRLACQTEII
ncbi:2Fe-2S iron-sulfur cluster-binding protein [Fictibacillus sp. NRS-1165]|uniref:2Fe-2S iron-sulfur cluster-binding protein n=1 Tax=Fictibacillus sp. NRS-1165 TaxID=3144463 RepID=UPI003D233929